MRERKSKQIDASAPAFAARLAKKSWMIFSLIKRGPRNAATKLALNPKVQGGDICGFLGFPSGGHAHQTQRDTAGLTFIGSRTCWIANTPGQSQYNSQKPMDNK